MKKQSDIQASILNAIIAGTRVRICFAMPDPDDAAYLARCLYLGFVDYAEWKTGSERSVATGNEKRLVYGESQSEQEARHQMVAHSRMRSHGRAHGVATAEGSGSGSGSGIGSSDGQLYTPSLQLFGPNADTASLRPVMLSESAGQSDLRSDFEQSSRSTSISDVEIESEGDAHGVAEGISVGSSRTTSVSETYVTTYESLPSQIYSAAEQLERAAGLLMNLAHRECIVKVDNQRPVRTRTADLPDAFRSAYAKRLALPILGAELSRSPYLHDALAVDAEIAARAAAFAAPTPVPPEPIATPQPIPNEPTLDPVGFAQNVFWTNRPSPPSPKPKPAPRKSARKPRLTVIDGTKGEGGDNEKPKR